MGVPCCRASGREGCEGIAPNSHPEGAPFEHAAQWDTTELPVPVELLVYTQAEWKRLAQEGRFYPTVMREAVWVYSR